MEYEPGRRHSNVILNLTPLIDIVFLLLVFFMLTAHFIKDEGISIDLPDARSSSSSEDKGFVDLVVTADGKLLLDGRAIASDYLEQALRGALHEPDKHIVRLRGDHEARFGLGVHVIDSARRAGAQAVDILTEKP